MSTYEKRGVRPMSLTVRDQLEAAHIEVPDQARARFIEKCVTCGAPLTSTRTQRALISLMNSGLTMMGGLVIGMWGVLAYKANPAFIGVLSAVVGFGVFATALFFRYRFGLRQSWTEASYDSVLYDSNFSRAHGEVPAFARDIARRIAGMDNPDLKLRVRAAFWDPILVVESTLTRERIYLCGWIGSKRLF